MIVRGLFHKVHLRHIIVGVCLSDTTSVGREIHPRTGRNPPTVAGGARHSLVVGALFVAVVVILGPYVSEKGYSLLPRRV